MWPGNIECCLVTSPVLRSLLCVSTVHRWNVAPIALWAVEVLGNSKAYSVGSRFCGFHVHQGVDVKQSPPAQSHSWGRSKGVPVRPGGQSNMWHISLRAPCRLR